MNQQLSWRTIVGYSLGDVANNFAFAMGALFLLSYYTDVAGVGAAAAGTMLLLVRVFDAFADVFAGRVVDSVNTRWGKFRPFLLFGTAPLMIFSVLVFWVPTDWSHGSKVVYAYLTYMGLGLCYSLVNIPYGSLSTRWYLDGDKSFGFALGAVKIKPSENSLLKLGRFGTDYSYGSLPYRIPLMAGSSQRTLPTVSEGALGYWALTPNIDLWGMWRSRVFLWTDSTTGIRDEGVYNSQTGKYDKHRARSFLAASWHDDTSRYSLGASVQKDVSNQIQSILEKSIPLDPNYTLKGELLGFYAQLEGLSRNTSQPNETALVSGQLTWNAPWGSVFGSGGYLRHAMNGAVVDTDIGYPFSLSLDRNREGMQSWQLGVNYRLTPQFTLTFAPIVTRGYESSKRDVRIEGTGILGGMNYRVSEGPLQGMNFFLAADKGREKRDGSTLGDRLNYWDVKMSIQYDFMLK